MTEPIWTLEVGEGPLVAAAIHNGHELRDEVARLMALGDAARLREEDPFSGEWTLVAPTRVVGLRSRFEVDLNRPRDKAVYRQPEDAWGLAVWRQPPPQELVTRSLDAYDAFYAAMDLLFSDLERQWGRFVVFDLHTYNHRRDGAEAAPADEAQNPQVNLGTGTMDRARWAPVVERFLADLRAHPFPGGPLDVRENVKFQGGSFSRWVHQRFPGSGCALAIELKKFFMDEWTGEPDRTLVDAIGQALAAAVPGVLAELERS